MQPGVMRAAALAGVQSWASSRAGANRIALAGLPRPEQPEIVLLTGATDLLGRFLLLETLQRMAAA